MVGRYIDRRIEYRMKSEKDMQCEENIRMVYGLVRWNVHEERMT